MKKIGLCCCYRQRNYGSQLQCLALVEELKKRDVRCEIIRYRKKLTPSFLVTTKVWSLPFNRVLLSERFMRYKKKLALLFHVEERRLNKLRNQRTAEFSDSRFGEILSRECVGCKQLKELAGGYDAVAVGSDQLWSPGGITGNFHNLMFVPDSVRKFSYATSFGVSKIPEGKRKLYRKFLQRLDFIGVRESSGADIVKELSGRRAYINADPALLLTRERWDALIEPKRVLDEPYIFAYFLGGNGDGRERALELKRLTGLKIAAVRHMDSYNRRDRDFGDFPLYDIGPEEFLNLIRGAEYVCTDSLHGALFSALYHKKLLIFMRYSDSSPSSKNTRIYSLCDSLALNDRLFDGGNLKSVLKERDYSETDERIIELRKRSREYLDRALKFGEGSDV